ncbi:MAG: hypothetical protein KIT80_15975 [Chitinophagaceae bacterium]|nr:hypothetical protein [Chitinophagaceae bacterium]MCW5928415.1 hypothetical protein [Chitinophagaceae bacterium]
MKKILPILIAVTVFGCKKENNHPVKGTVLTVNSGITVVAVENPDPNKYSFICSNDMMIPEETINSCTKNVFVLNLPGGLQVEGKKIQFSKYKDKGPNPIWSVSFAAHDLEVYDARER